MKHLSAKTLLAIAALVMACVVGLFVLYGCAPIQSQQIDPGMMSEGEAAAYMGAQSTGPFYGPRIGGAQANPNAFSCINVGGGIVHCQ